MWMIPGNSRTSSSDLARHQPENHHRPAQLQVEMHPQTLVYLRGGEAMLAEPRIGWRRTAIAHTGVRQCLH